MADSADVENGIAVLLTEAFYPNGNTQPSTIGSTIVLMRGWPTEAQIDTAVAAGAVLISVFAEKGMARDTTRYFRDFHGSCGVPTITVTIAGLAITFAGTVTVGHALAVQCAGVWYTYLVQAGDTLASIATAFAGQISGASAAGAVLTLPSGGRDPQARVVMSGKASAFVSQQKMPFRISCWAPTPALRDAVFANLPGQIAYLGSRLTMPDGTIATWLGQRESGPDDVPARANEWRRDIQADYEWQVIYTMQAMALLVLEMSIDLTDAPS